MRNSGKIADSGSPRLNQVLGLIVILLFAGWLLLFFAFESRLEHVRKELNASEDSRFKLEKEVVQFRAELGGFTVSEADVDKIHALAIDTLEPLHWRWRLYVPKGTTYWLHAGMLYGTQESQQLGAGEHLLDVALLKDPRGRWNWHISDRNHFKCQLPLGKHASVAVAESANLDSVKAGLGGVSVSAGTIDLLEHPFYPAGISGAGNVPLDEFLLRISNVPMESMEPDPTELPNVWLPAIPTNSLLDDKNLWKVELVLRLLVNWAM